METKVCECCGETLPLNKFHQWIRKDGSIGTLYQCLKCQHKEANKRYYDKKKRLSKKQVMKIETDVLIEELKRRGIEGF